MKQIQEKQIVIENPSKKVLEFVHGLKKRKEDRQKALEEKAKFFFPNINS